MSNFETLEGNNPIDLSEAVHIIIPGRGRAEGGMALTPQGEARVDTAAALYTSEEMDYKGYIVPSGYKTPAETSAQPWQLYPGAEVFMGMPEAFLMADRLHAKHIGAISISPEIHSTDSVSNFVRAEHEGHFGPGHEPVAIVAQEEHLERMVRYIAPKTLRRDYIGVVVPEDVENKDPDSVLGQLFSRAVLFGMRADTPDLVTKTERRSSALWTVMLRARKLTAR